MNSIEWLIEELTPSIALQQKYIDELKEKAKEMHKQEMKDAFTEGEFNIHNSKRDEGFEYETSEQYYQETFKKELTSQLPGINVNDVKPSNPQMVKENFSIKCTSKK